MSKSTRVKIVQEIDDSTLKIIGAHPGTKAAYDAIAKGTYGDGPFTVVDVRARGVVLEAPKPVKRGLVFGERLGGRPTKPAPEKSKKK